ncbi:MAG: dihydroneopterin aldolase [Patescibacteria group bacterium]
MDTLTLYDFELWTRIGVPVEERANEQHILVTVKLTLDPKDAASKDEPSIDYDLVAAELKKISRTKRKTIERFAEDAAGAILKRFKPASVTVSIKKFAVLGAKFVEIGITRP